MHYVIDNMQVAFCAISALTLLYQLSYVGCQYNGAVPGIIGGGPPSNSQGSVPSYGAQQLPAPGTSYGSSQPANPISGGGYGIPFPSQGVQQGYGAGTPQVPRPPLAGNPLGIGGYGLPPSQPVSGQGYGGNQAPPSGGSQQGYRSGGPIPISGQQQGYGVAPIGSQQYGSSLPGSAQRYSGALPGVQSVPQSGFPPGPAQSYGAGANPATQTYGIPQPIPGAFGGYGNAPGGTRPQGYGAQQPGSYGGGAQQSGSYGGGAQQSGSYGGGAQPPIFPGGSTGYGNLPAIGGYGGSAPGAYSGTASGSTRCNFDRNCYDSQANCALGNALPFERRAPSMCDECVTLCTQRQQNLTDKYRCSTAVYDYTAMTCDLFAVPAAAGYYPLVPYPNRDVFVARPGCIGMPGSVTQSVTGSVTGSVTTRPPNPSSSCEANEVVRYLAVRGFVQTGNDDYSVTGDVSLEQCAQTCTDNRLPDGTQINCASFDYGPGNQCMLSRSAVAPTGTGTLETRDNGAYLEKICVASGAVANCNTPIFERYPMKILVGFAQTAIDAGSFDECLDACLQSQQRFSFRCLSGQFFAPTGQTNEMNCVLNTETKDSHPELFGDDPDEATDYFEIPSECVPARRNAVRKPNVTTHSAANRAPGIFKSAAVKSMVEKNDRAAILLDKWTLWSFCGTKDSVRTRYRRCEFLDIRQCPRETEPCRQRDVAPLPDDKESVKEDTITVEDEVVPLNRCICMKDSLGRLRCDIGVKYTRSNTMEYRKEYCNNPI